MPEDKFLNLILNGESFEFGVHLPLLMVQAIETRNNTPGIQIIKYNIPRNIVGAPTGHEITDVIFLNHKEAVALSEWLIRWLKECVNVG